MSLVGISNDSWQGCLTEGKEYEVLAVYGHYVLIEEDSGRIVWNYVKLFELVGEHEQDKVNVEFKVNWNII